MTTDQITKLLGTMTEEVEAGDLTAIAECLAEETERMTIRSRHPSLDELDFDDRLDWPYS